MTNRIRLSNCKRIILFKISKRVTKKDSVKLKICLIVPIP